MFINEKYHFSREASFIFDMGVKLLSPMGHISLQASVCQSVGRSVSHKTLSGPLFGP